MKIVNKGTVVGVNKEYQYCIIKYDNGKYEAVDKKSIWSLSMTSRGPQLDLRYEKNIEFNGVGGYEIEASWLHITKLPPK